MLPKRNYIVKQIKKNNSHVYQVSRYAREDLMLPGCTGVLQIIGKPGLVPWATGEALKMAQDALLRRLNGQDEAQVLINREWVANVILEAKKKPEAIKNEAASLGTQAHAVFDAIVLNKPIPSFDPRIKETIERFKLWLKESNLKMVAGDTCVASLKYGFGGALDAIGELNTENGKEYVLIDYKTSNNTYDSYALQVAAYSQAFEETYNIKCSKAVIVRIGKEKKDKKGNIKPVEFEISWLKDIDDSFEAFKNALALSESLKHSHFI